ncbi:hypothetical protein C8R32_102266 [Nitrosospira sp. Nsp5]|uniref:Uncharacterized protein n=1 Tax=Nitrosospira multiformis TaxID=1231 RepID=A0ABY0TK23_9PROT|nr:hypothetical protein C8R32_102266 [Nitrosospira sp. Nsp5]SDQ95808.1 hypothetical protein SAMN05216402_2992 [Nitrosospira multiformis]
MAAGREICRFFDLLRELGIILNPVVGRGVKCAVFGVRGKKLQRSYVP